MFVVEIASRFVGDIYFFKLLDPKRDLLLLMMMMMLLLLLLMLMLKLNDDVHLFFESCKLFFFCPLLADSD